MGDISQTTHCSCPNPKLTVVGFFSVGFPLQFFFWKFKQILFFSDNYGLNVFPLKAVLGMSFITLVKFHLHAQKSVACGSQYINCLDNIGLMMKDVSSLAKYVCVVNATYKRFFWLSMTIFCPQYVLSISNGSATVTNPASAAIKTSTDNLYIIWDNAWSTLPFHCSLLWQKVWSQGIRVWRWSWGPHTHTVEALHHTILGRSKHRQNSHQTSLFMVDAMCILQQNSKNTGKLVPCICCVTCFGNLFCFMCHNVNTQILSFSTSWSKQ